MSLNIDDINTVSDLLDGQETDQTEETTSPEADRIIKELLDESPAVGIDVCSRIIYALREFHAEGVETYIEEGKPEYAAQWAADHSKLDLIYNLIKDIQV